MGHLALFIAATYIWRTESPTTSENDRQVSYWHLLSKSEFNAPMRSFWHLSDVNRSKQHGVTAKSILGPWHASETKILRFGPRFGPYCTDRHENFIITFLGMHGSRNPAHKWWVQKKKKTLEGRLQKKKKTLKVFDHQIHQKLAKDVIGASFDAQRYEVFGYRHGKSVGSVIPELRGLGWSST